MLREYYGWDEDGKSARGTGPPGMNKAGVKKTSIGQDDIEAFIYPAQFNNEFQADQLFDEF